MKKLHRTELLLLAGILFAVLVSHLPVMYTILYHQLTGIPKSEKGRVKLMDADLNKPIVLDGKWEFYWKHLLVTENKLNLKPDLLITVPDYWSRYQLKGSYLPAKGYASYRLVLEEFSEPEPITVYLPDFGSAYRVYIDGVLTAKSGIVTEKEKGIFTTTEVVIYPVVLSASKEHEIVIEVATTRFSGLYLAPVLKSYNSALMQGRNQNNLRMIILGSVLFSFFVLIIIYIVSYRKNKRSVWLPITGLLVLVRILMTTGFYPYWENILFVDISYEATNSVMFLVSFIFKYLLIFMMEELLGIGFSKKEKLAFFIYYAVLYLLYLFIPHGIYNRHLTILLPVCAFMIEIYSFFKIYHNRNRLKKYGIVVYWGAVLAITGLVIDCYYINGNIYLNLSLALLVLFCAYLMILSMVSAMITADVYRDFAISSSLLTQARKQITMQTEYYEALSTQINEVRAIRHDVRHFVGVIRQLSEEKRYEELSVFLSEYVEKSDGAPLPLFCENVVANSILGYYSLRFKKNDIPFHCTCQIPKVITVSDSDLCIILGNALENAFEALGKQKQERTRYLSVEAKSINSQILIKITNTYNGKVHRRDGSFLTTKTGGSHGFGIKNIKKVVETCKGIVKVEYKDQTFTLMVALPNTVKEE